MKTFKRKRLRKKYQTGEFAQTGFNVTLHMSPPIDEEQSNTLWDALIEFVERNNYAVCGATKTDRIEWIFCKGRYGRRMRNGYVRWHQNVPSSETDRECVRHGIEEVWAQLGFNSTLTVDIGSVHVL